MVTTIDQGGDDRPPNTQMDSVETFAREAALRSEADVLEGLRELEGAEGVKWFIYRINAADPNQNGFLDRWGTALLTQENLRDKFGPGTYKVRGHYPNGTYAAHRTIDIAGDAPRRDPKTVTTPVVGAPTDIAQVMLMLDEREARRRAEAEAHRAEDRSFWKGLAATLAPILAPKILDMVTGGGNRQGTVTELLSGLKELKALDGTKDSKSSLKETLELFALMRDNFDTGGRVGEKGPWDALTELAKAAGPKVGALVEALPNLANAARPSLPINAAPVLRVTSSSPQNGVRVAGTNTSSVPATESVSVSVAGVESDGMNSPKSDAESTPSQTSPMNQTQASGEDMNLDLLPLLPFFRRQLEFLLVKASGNRDPELYADLLLDNLPENIPPRLLYTFVSREDWFEQMQRFDERVQPYHGWFQQFRDFLVDELKIRLEA